MADDADVVERLRRYRSLLLRVADQELIDDALSALSSAKAEEREACARMAKNILDDESHRLIEIFEAYCEASGTGRFNERRITPEQAKRFAGSFRERAEAVIQAADLVAAAIRSRKDTP